MNKILIFVFLSTMVIILSNCEIKVKQSRAENAGGGWKVERDFKVISGMTYLITRQYYHTTITNVTKDAFEVELLKEKIKRLKSGREY